MCDHDDIYFHLASIEFTTDPLPIWLMDDIETIEAYNNLVKNELSKKIAKMVLEKSDIDIQIGKDRRVTYMMRIWVIPNEDLPPWDHDTKK